MTPEEKQKLEDLERRLKEAEEYIAQKKIQQISLPLDDASRNVIGVQEGVNDSSNFFTTEDATTLTISGGVIDVNQTYHTVDTEGAAASDNLDTINATGLTGAGLVILRAESSGRTIVLKDGTGNLRLAGDFSLDHSRDTITLFGLGGTWYEISRSDNDT